MNKKWFWISSLVTPLLGIVLVILADATRFFPREPIALIIAFLYLHFFYKTIKDDSLGKSILIFFVFAIVTAVASGIYTFLYLTIADAVGVYLGDMSGLLIGYVPLVALVLFGVGGIFTLIFKKLIINLYDFSRKENINFYLLGILVSFVIFVLIFPISFIDGIKIGHKTSLALRDAFSSASLISIIAYPLSLLIFLVLINIFIKTKNIKKIEKTKLISLIIAIAGYLITWLFFAASYFYEIRDVIRIPHIGLSLISGISIVVFVGSCYFLKHARR